MDDPRYRLAQEAKGVTADARSVIFALADALIEVLGENEKLGEVLRRVEANTYDDGLRELVRTALSKEDQ